MDETSSPKIANLGVTVAELDKIQSSRKRIAMMNAITSPDFERVAIQTQFLAGVIDADDHLKKVYVSRLGGLIEDLESRLAAARAAYRNVSGRPHGRDPVKF
jgi:hypothetical protein